MLENVTNMCLRLTLIREHPLKFYSLIIQASPVRRNFKLNPVVHYVIWIYLLPFHVDCLKLVLRTNSNQKKLNFEVGECRKWKSIILLMKDNQEFWYAQSYTHLLLHCKHFIITSCGDLTSKDGIKYLGSRVVAQTL